MTVEERLQENDALAHWAVLRWVRIAESHPDYDDAVQEARVAMVRAAETFDDNRKCKFSTLACICIKNQLNHFNARARRHGFYFVPPHAEIHAPVQLVHSANDDYTPKQEWHSDKAAPVADAVDARDAITLGIRRLFAVHQLAARVLWARHILGLSSDEVAERMGISRQRVCGLAASGRQKMKYLLGDLNLVVDN